MPTAKPTYQQLSTELESIIVELQSADSDIDLAIKHYERGLEVVKQLDDYLKTADNKITELKAKFATDK